MKKLLILKMVLQILKKINLGNDLEDGEYEVKISLVNNKKTDYETSINFNIFSVVNSNENKSITILKEDKN